MSFLKGPERGVLSRLDRRKMIGLRIGTVGLMMGMLGAFLMVYGPVMLGKTVFLVGFAAVFVGVFVTLVLTVLPGSGKGSDN